MIVRDLMTSSMRLRNMLLRQLTFFAHKMVAKENIFFEKLCMINLFFRCVEIGIGVKHRKSKARRHGTGLLDFLWGWTRGNGWYKVPSLWKWRFPDSVTHSLVMIVIMKWSRCRVTSVLAVMATGRITASCMQRRLKRATFWRCNPRIQICCGSNVYDW